MRWWQEFRSPLLKCARLDAHKPVENTREFYAWPSTSWNGVADIVVEERTICKRCKQVIKPWKEARREDIQGLSMASDHWAILKDTGRFPR